MNADTANGLPTVLALSGLDPTGGAGLQADIEAIASQGCHAAPVATAVTVQDTSDVFGVTPLTPQLVIQQARAVLEDMPVTAVKIGLLGSVEIIEAVHVLLTDYPDIPVVLDPVLQAGGGAALADEAMIAAMQALLLPRAAIITPNSFEARALAPEADTPDACGLALSESGADYVLITGADIGGREVNNVLYGNHRVLRRYTWERLPGRYHGSGCTLSAALAGLLAHGLGPLSAVYEAQSYTWRALRQGYRIGMGQFVPNRFFWTRKENNGR